MSDQQQRGIGLKIRFCPASEPHPGSQMHLHCDRNFERTPELRAEVWASGKDTSRTLSFPTSGEDARKTLIIESKLFCPTYFQ